MIYTPITKRQYINIPIVNKAIGSHIKIINQLTNYSAVESVTIDNEHYKVYVGNFNKLYETPAQYDFEVYYFDNDNKIIVQTGILQIGDITNKQTTYNSDINIKTYNG